MATHLRDFLMESNVLPQAGRRLLLYERWLAKRRAAVHDPARHQLPHRFATWYQLLRLRTKADAGRTPPASQEGMAVVRPMVNLARRKGSYETGRQLKRQRQPVEPGT